MKIEDLRFPNYSSNGGAAAGQPCTKLCSCSESRESLSIFGSQSSENRVKINAGKTQLRRARPIQPIQLILHLTDDAAQLHVLRTWTASTKWTNLQIILVSLFICKVLRGELNVADGLVVDRESVRHLVTQVSSHPAGRVSCLEDWIAESRVGLQTDRQRVPS